MTDSGPSEHECEADTSLRPAGSRHRAGTLGLAGALLLLFSVQVLGNNPQRAIEELENCSARERSSGSCVKILKREPAGEGRERIKVQLRGGRIIWYEFDRKTGRVRRAN